MSLSGSIEDLPLLEILQVVSFCQKTGFLTVRSPQGDAGVVFRDGRVLTGYIWDVPSAGAGSRQGPERVRARLGQILERLVRLREGEFAFNLAEQAPSSLGGRDLSGDTLADGINPEELMLELARKLDEDRRDTTASLAASFTEPQAAMAAVEGAPSDAPPGDSEAIPSRETPDATTPQELAAVPAAADASSAMAPLVAEAQPLEELVIEEPADAPSGAGPSVLLVDDEPEVCDAVGRQLQQAGIEVRAVHGVAEARREMGKLASARTRFLLVVDLGLPSESGSSFRAGLDVVRLASGLPAPPPVLLMSEAIDEKLIGRARRLGVSLLAFKPGLSKLDPLQYGADLRAFGDKLARDLLPRLAGRRGVPPTVGVCAPASPEAESRDRTLAAAIAEIEAHPDPDMVAFLLLRAARACFVRAILFVIRDDCLSGLSGFGPVREGRSLDLLARELTLPLDRPSPFAEVATSRRPWSGPLALEGPLATVAATIGRQQAQEAAILPLCAAGETLAMVYADAPDGSAMAAVEPFVAFLERAGRALDAALSGRARRDAPR